MKKTVERSLNVDLVRVMAMMMVILLHTILNFTIRPDFFPSKLFFLLEPIVALSKTCVLLFFMLSGYLVISKNRTLNDNLAQTRKKILIPLAFFGILNVLYAGTKFPLGEKVFSEFVSAQIQRMVSFPSSPLWFLVVLFFLYMLNPVWQLVFAKDQKPEIARFLTLSFLMFSLTLTIVQFPALKINTMFNSFTGWTGFVFFYLYGALVRNKWITSGNQKVNLALILVGLALIMAGDFMTMWQKVHAIPFMWNDYTGNYLSVPVTMTAIGIFNFCMSLDLSKYKSDFLAWMAELSFGIYLIHTFVISMFTDVLGFDFNKLNMNVYVYNMLNVALVLSISMILTLGIKRIPKLKAVVGG